MRWSKFLAFVLVAACSGGGDGGDPAGPDAKPVSTVTVTLNASQVVQGATTTASAQLRDASGAALSGRTVSWSSSNSNVASVTSTGVVTAVSSGSAAIIATSEGQSGSATLTVLPPPVASVQVSLATSQLIAGEMTAASAVLRSSSGAVLSGRSISWTSTNQNVATVTDAGMVTSLSGGTTMITATSEGITGQAQLVVQHPPVTSVVVTGASRVKVGDNYSYVATARLANGTVVNRPMTWSVPETNRAIINQNGVLTALQPGSFTIVVTIDGVQWFSDYTAYDWETFGSGGANFAALKADNTITNQFGTTNYSELIVSCGSSGYFFVWVRTPHVITSSGLVALSFDGGSAYTETWDELSPDYNTLWKRGSNGTVKAFAMQIASSRTFGFAFTEFLSSVRAMIFRVTGLTPRLQPLLTQCPSNSLEPDPAAEAADLASVRNALASMRSGGISSRDAAPAEIAGARARSAPSVGDWAKLLSSWPVFEAATRSARRRK